MKNTSYSIPGIHDPQFVSTIGRIPFPIDDVETSLPQRFEKIVNLDPSAIAIQSRENTLTYAELNALANQIAQTISTKLGRRNKQIGLLVEKGGGQVAGMLGILKSGNIFVPIDSSLPKERIEAILEHSQSELLLTDSYNESIGIESIGDQCRLIVLESVSASAGGDNLCLPMSSLDPAYIIYTSGSTGQPKGVLKNHANQLHAVMRRTNSEGVHRGDRIVLLPNGTANAIANIFQALLNGAVLLPFDVKKEGVSRLADWLREERITICQIASPLFRNLCSVLPHNNMFPELRLLRLRSEAVYRADVDLYKKYFLPTCMMVNGLSSSETGAISEFHIHHGTEFNGNEVPVGYSLEGMEVLLLDDEGMEIGFNELGEIAIRSKYLSPGYWNQADLTKAKYKVDPMDPEKRLYYTGDLGLKLADGCLVHKGRKDFRVKIRGYGVDLIEVEKNLLSYPGIRQAIVVALKNNVGELYLVGYFSSGIQPPPNVSELRMFLRDKLADYMIPSTFIELDAIPLTANGKIDRKALPIPDSSRPNIEAPYVAPQSIQEKQLVRIWEKVLGVCPIGIHDNFFDLGGQSLLGSKIIAQVEREFQTEIPVGWLFESRTISAFTKLLDASVNIDFNLKCENLKPLQIAKSDRQVFCFPHAGGFRNEYSRFIKIAQLIGSNYSFYGLMSQGADGKSEPLDSVENMASEYVKTIQSAQARGPYMLIAECGGAAEAYETARQLSAKGEEICLLAFLDGHLSGELFKDIRRRLLGRFRYRIRDCKTLCLWIIRGTANTVRQMRQFHGRQRAQYLLTKVPAVKRLKSEASLMISSRASQADMDRTLFNRRMLRHLKRADEFHKQAVVRYRHHWFRYYAPPFAGKITLLVNEDWHSKNPTLGWEKVKTGGLEVHKIPGNHHTYITTYIEIVAEKLREVMLQVDIFRGLNPSDLKPRRGNYPYVGRSAGG